MKTYRRLKLALAAANGKPLLQIHGPKGTTLYVVADFSSLDSVAILQPNNHGSANYAGQVSLGHLTRLGNANHATEHPEWSKGPKADFSWNKAAQI